VLPPASRAVTVSTFVPIWRAIPLAVQLVVPLAVPLPPWLLVHVTCVTPTLSDAVPPTASEELLVVKVGLLVGVVMVTVGAVESVPVPVTIRERVSPSAAKLTFVVAVADVVGVKRTITAWLAPAPTRVNGLPETILNGAEVDTVPDTVPPPVFDTVKT
jgi:predicted transporter